MLYLFSTIICGAIALVGARINDNQPNDFAAFVMIFGAVFGSVSSIMFAFNVIFS